MGQGGKTVTPWWDDGCDADAMDAIATANVTAAKRSALRATLAASCNSGIYSPKKLEIWKPIRGQCVTYRKDQQSCIGEWHARGHCSRTQHPASPPGWARGAACHAHASNCAAHGSRRPPR